MKPKKIALYGILIALALILSYVESMIPFSFAVPGIKAGLPNIAVLFALYKLGTRDACIISILRVFLVSLLFGNFYSLAYSLTGAVLSLLVMVLLKRTEKFSIAGVSVSGGVAHNIGQLLIALLFLKRTEIAAYFPALCISGVAAGILIGLLSSVLVNRVKITDGN